MPFEPLTERPQVGTREANSLKFDFSIRPSISPGLAQLVPDGPVVDIQDMDQYHCAGVYRNLHILVWGVQTMLKAVEQARLRALAFSKTLPNGGGLLTIVEDGAQLPSAEVRAVLSKMMGEGSGWVKCSAVVQEGTGFRAAAIRAVVTGLSQFARQPYPHHVFDSVAVAAPWLTSKLPVHRSGATTATELSKVVADMRREFDGFRHRRC